MDLKGLNEYQNYYDNLINMEASNSNNNTFESHSKNNMQNNVNMVTEFQKEQTSLNPDGKYF